MLENKSGKKKPYVVRRLEQWLGNTEGSLEDAVANLRLTGFDGLQARVLLSGSTRHRWLHDLKPWNDKRYPTAVASDHYREAFDDNRELIGRPAYREALVKYVEHEQKRDEERANTKPSKSYRSR